MLTTLRMLDGSTIDYDPFLGGFNPRPMPCLQCGTCCSRWQAPVTTREISTIADGLGIPLRDFYTEYLREYPVRPNSYLVKHKDGACIFLRYRDRKSFCSIHGFKPWTCREWTPSLARKECRDGLKKLAGGDSLATPADLQLPQAELHAFCRSLSHYSIMGAGQE